MDPGASGHAEALLLKAGRSYGVPVARDDVQRALADPDRGAAFVEWANLHLASDHLLTVDELAVYTALDRSGQVDLLADAHDLGEVQAVSEDDIRAAIEELNRSTATISKQTETLRQQQDALSRLVKKRGENEAQRRDLESTRLRESESQRKKLAAEVTYPDSKHSISADTARQVEDLSHGLGYRLSDLEQQTKDVRTILNETVDGVLHSDDKLLSSLQKLGWELDQRDPEEQQTVEKLQEICMRLIKTTVETLRTRLDRIYIEAVLAAERAGQGKSATGNEVKELEEELESLYSEILPVAQMSTEQEYLEPALQSTNSQSGQSLRRSAVAVTYINESLDYLLDRIDLLGGRVETLNSHQAATSSIISKARDEVSTAISPVQKPVKQATPASPVRKPSPIRMRSNTTGHSSRSTRRRSSGIQDEPAMEALLRNLALTLPPAQDSTSHEQAAELAQVIADRSAKAEDVARNAQETFEANSVAKLQDARLAIQLLRDSILAESPFGEVRLVDPEIEGSIQVLGQEIDKVKGQLDAVDVKKGVKSSKKAEFVQRWAS
ncbi:hypothetical protein AK830_g11226 [Neonectria ditissima]|uniref:HAUS augmin-like complex subunit 3 N-terminal domain-containing protein n=1 Tax=Neonectria ditissima TaxID=78410 RepID=A0A0P7ARN8_9HYPO|nr:hypothetical protein AK830_g11226 [Neonectria ditissima]